jgi:hypothetical protein
MEDDDLFSDIFDDDGGAGRKRRSDAPQGGRPGKASRDRDEDAAGNLRDFIDDTGASDVGSDEGPKYYQPSKEELQEEQAEEAKGQHNNAIDEAMVAIKKSLRKGKDKIDDKVKKNFILQLIEDMTTAQEMDKEEVKHFRPALAKLALCDRLERVAAKGSIVDEFVEEGGVKLISAWLSPLPDPYTGVEDKVIPNVNVRTACFKALMRIEEHRKLEIPRLREANIGRVCLNYRKMASETNPNKKLCAQLCTRWMNTVVEGGETRFSFNEIESDPPKEVVVQRTVSDATTTMNANSQHRHARIPRREEFKYKVRPEIVEVDEAKRDPESNAAQVNRKLNEIRSGSMRATTGRDALGTVHISVAGHGLQPPDSAM